MIRSVSLLNIILASLLPFFDSPSLPVSTFCKDKCLSFNQKNKKNENSRISRISMIAWQKRYHVMTIKFLENMTPIPNGFNLERLVVLVRHGARTTLSQAKVLQPQEWIMKNLINTVSIISRVIWFR